MHSQHFMRLILAQDDLILRRVLFKLFHIEQALDHNAEEIKSKSRSLQGLRDEKEAKDQDLEEARREQAVARSEVSAKEKRLKKAEKTIEAKVRLPASVSLAC